MKLLDALKSGRPFRVNRGLFSGPWMTGIAYNEGLDSLELINEDGESETIYYYGFGMDDWEIKPEFKVGDRVKVPEQFGIIEKGEDSNGHVLVRFGNKNRGLGYWVPGDLIKISEDEIPAKEIKENVIRCPLCGGYQCGKPKNEHT